MKFVSADDSGVWPSCPFDIEHTARFLNVLFHLATAVLKRTNSAFSFRDLFTPDVFTKYVHPCVFIFIF